MFLESNWERLLNWPDKRTLHLTHSKRPGFLWKAWTRCEENFNEKKKKIPETKKRRNPQGLTCCVAGSLMMKEKRNGFVVWGKVHWWPSENQRKEGVCWRTDFAYRHGLTWTQAEAVGDWSLEQRKKHRLLQADWAKGTVSKNWILGNPGYLEIHPWNIERIN